MMYRRLSIPAAVQRIGWNCRKMSGSGKMEVCMKAVLIGLLAVVGIAVVVVFALAHGERVCREISDLLERY